MLNRRTLLTTAGATVALATPLAGMAQGRKDAIVIGMALEPPGLDPTAGAAAATRVPPKGKGGAAGAPAQKGAVVGALAGRWEVLELGWRNQREACSLPAWKGTSAMMREEIRELQRQGIKVNDFNRPAPKNTQTPAPQEDAPPLGIWEKPHQLHQQSKKVPQSGVGCHHQLRLA